MLKELLGEELYSQVTEKLGDKKIMVDDGNFIPKSRFDQVNQAKKELEVQLKDRDTQLADLSKNNKDNEVITVHIDYNKTDSQEIKFKNEENKKRLLYLLEYIKEEGIYKKIDNIDMTKPNSINMSTKEDINILLNSDEELKYNISRLAMILADLQNKKQKGGEIDLSTGKYALYRP